MESGKFDINSYWVSYVRDRARQGLKNVGEESLSTFRLSYEQVGLATYIRCNCEQSTEPSTLKEPHLFEVKPRKTKLASTYTPGDQKKSAEYSVNLSAVIGAHQLGASYVCMARYHNGLGMKSLSQMQFKSCEKKVGPVLMRVAEKSMSQASKEEIELTRLATNKTFFSPTYGENLRQ